jgi:hypothetical protein
LCAAEPFRSILREAGFNDAGELPRGKVLGYVEVTGCFPTHDLTAHEIVPEQSIEWIFGDYRPGRWAWLCQWPTRLEEPFPFPGWRALYDVPDHLFRRPRIPRFPITDDLNRPA